MICGHENRREFRAYPGAMLYECLKCRFVFIDQREKKPEPKVLYEEYYKNETGGRFNLGLEYVIRMFRFFRALKVFLLYPGAKSILDIGSGRGFMLYYLKKYYGYHLAMGTQLSKNALEFSRKKLGLEIFDQDFLDLPLNDLSFDLITLWHVLEHVPHPEAYIAKIRQFLNEKGKLIVEVPNLDSWTARFSGPYWLGLDLKYHLHFFSPSTLIRLLEKYDFEIRNVHTFSLEYSIFISVSSFVSRLTHTDHLLFEWLETGRFKPVLLWHIALFILFFPICFLINILLFFSRRGEVLLVVAEKETSA
jgi:SAM-dependent methyltransferase